ncbi:MAG: (d)CMP kinase [Phycisphaerae bacterium]|nr:(d)CMP kinase [Phycisphaerae bacterium]
MADMIVTIDGPAGVGKSTVAHRLAERLGAAFLDTGAMYRALTLAAIRKNVPLTDADKVLEVLRASDFQFRIADAEMTAAIDGQDVTAAIRTPEITAQVRHVAAAPMLRAALVDMQRRFAAEQDAVVTEGRDQGTVAFPDAPYKFFLTADVDERAKRRKRQLAQCGTEVDITAIRYDMIERDTSDENRSTGPLVPAADAVMIDTTNLQAEEVVDTMMEHIKGERHGYN